MATLTLEQREQRLISGLYSIKSRIRDVKYYAVQNIRNRIIEVPGIGFVKGYELSTEALSLIHI